MARLTVGTPRMKKILLARVANANAKGHGYKFSAGYNASWTEMAKEMAALGQVSIRMGRIYLDEKEPVKKAKVVKQKRTYTKRTPKVQESNTELSLPAPEVAPTVVPEAMPEVAQENILVGDLQPMNTAFTAVVA